MKPSIYLDNHSTTPLDPRVLAAMLPYYQEDFGNAASRAHAFGWKAEAAVEKARAQVARLVGATPEEIIFTSGATESDNLAILGVARAWAGEGRHLITVATEHHAVLDPFRQLEKEGCEVTVLPVDAMGQVDPAAIAAAIKPHTRLVSVMSANNEIGTLQPIAAIGRLVQEKGILFHCDAVQSLGKLPFQVSAMGVDLLSISGHKIYGPKGIGALYIRKRRPRIQLQPLMFGGGHEQGLRPGTLAVPLIVGLGEALAIAGEMMEAESQRLSAWRDRLWQKISSALPELALNGHPTERLPNNLNVSFFGVDGAALLKAMDGVAVSSGSACTSAKAEPSYVLQAIGRSKELAQASLRFGLGRFNTEEEIDRAAEQVVRVVRELRALHSL